MVARVTLENCLVALIKKSLLGAKGKKGKGGGLKFGHF